MERYNRGENPYAMPMPTPTKELLVWIIRLCPITEKDIHTFRDQSLSKRNGPIQRHLVYSSDWLVKDLGYRSIIEKSRNNRQFRLDERDLTGRPWLLRPGLGGDQTHNPAKRSTKDTSLSSARAYASSMCSYSTRSL
jgi:hypothetical protein